MFPRRGRVHPPRHLHQTAQTGYRVRRKSPGYRRVGQAIGQHQTVNYRRAHRLPPDVEEPTRQTRRLQNFMAEIALLNIQHLAGPCHSNVGGEFAGQVVVNQRRDKQPGVCLFQQLRVIFFSHTSLYSVLKPNAPTPEMS